MKICTICDFREAHTHDHMERDELGEWQCVGEVECCNSCYYTYYATPEEQAELSEARMA